MRVPKLILGKIIFLHISLCFSASSLKRPDGHVLASKRAWLFRSLIWQHAIRTSMYHIRTRAFCFLCQIHTTFCMFYHVVLCAFALRFLSRYRYSLHILSHPRYFLWLSLFSYVLILFKILENLIDWNDDLRDYASFSVFMLDGYCYICVRWSAISTFCISLCIQLTVVIIPHSFWTNKI